MFRSRTGVRRRSLAVLLAIISLTGAVGVAISAPTASAVLGDLPAISYNLQGATTRANGQSDSKWTTVIQSYARRAQVVAIQEAGRAPDPPRGVQPVILTAAQLANANAVNLPQIGIANQVTHSQWTTASLANLDVYFLQTDPNSNPRTHQPTYMGGRNNLAIVTHRPADAVAAIPNPLGGRATLGVLLGTDWYFSIHGFSGNGNDALPLLNAINTFVTGRNRGESWAALGDFNRDPSTLATPAGTAIARTLPADPPERSRV
jgi:hypothetical protein